MSARLSAATVERLSEFVPRRDLEAMRVVRSAPFRWLPAALGMAASTFGSFVFFRKGYFDEGSVRGLALIAHEAVHIGQAREMSLPVFLVRYLVGNVRCGFKHDRHVLEIPAIAVQRRVAASVGLRAEDSGLR
jgi:hypothetical protein